MTTNRLSAVLGTWIPVHKLGGLSSLDMYGDRDRVEEELMNIALESGPAYQTYDRLLKLQEPALDALAAKLNAEESIPDEDPVTPLPIVEVGSADQFGARYVLGALHQVKRLFANTRIELDMPQYILPGLPSGRFRKYLPEIE